MSQEIDRIFDAYEQGFELMNTGDCGKVVLEF